MGKDIGKRTLAVLAAALALQAAGGDFVFVTSDNPGGRKLTFEPVDQYNFAEKAPTITTYVTDQPLQAVLRDSFQRQGVELLSLVRFDPQDPPSYYRVRVGFAQALGYSWNGVYIDGYDKLTAPYREAVEQAKEDVAFVNRFKRLVDEACSDEDQIIVSEGRRGRKMIARLGVQSTDPERMRYELDAWIRRLESVFGRPHGPDPKPAKAIAWEPPPAIPDGLKVIGVRVPCANLPLDAKTNITFSCDWRGYTITVKNAKKTCSLGLVLSSFGENEYLRYDAVQDLFPPKQPVAPKDLPPAAGFPSRWLFNAVEPRFHRVGSDWHFKPHGVYCRAYPDIGLGHRVDRPKQGAKGTTNVVFSAGWAPLYGRWPSSTPGRSDAWRVTVGGEGPTCDVKLLWPKGTEPMRQKFVSMMPGGDEKTFKSRADSQYEHFLFARDDFDFAFAPSKGKENERFFEFGDIGSDWFFWNAYGAPFCDKRPTAERSATLLWDIAEGRREYLEACYKGGPFRKAPPPKKPTGAAAATAPDADADVETIELDDPE